MIVIPAKAGAQLSPRRFLRIARKHRDKSRRDMTDRKSTRLNSSHRTISYAVFCLKKKKDISLYSFRFLDKTQFISLYLLFYSYCAVIVNCEVFTSAYINRRNLTVPPFVCN